MIIDIKQFLKKPPIIHSFEPQVQIPLSWLKYLVHEFEFKNDTLVAISEYWNRDTNEHAMSDAIWRMIEMADDAITVLTDEDEVLPKASESS